MQHQNTPVKKRKTDERAAKLIKSATTDPEVTVEIVESEPIMSVWQNMKGHIK